MYIHILLIGFFFSCAAPPQPKPIIMPPTKTSALQPNEETVDTLGYMSAYEIWEFLKENPEINMLSRWCIRPMYNLQKYEPGGGYHVLHCENYNKGLQHTTTLVWMYYLNPVKVGGGTYFSNFDSLS